MAEKAILRSVYLVFAFLSMTFLYLSVSSYYSCFLDIKSLKYLAMDVDDLVFHRPNNETYLLFNLHINNSAGGQVIILRQEFELFVAGELIRARTIDFSSNELIIPPYDLIAREVSMEIPSFKLYLFAGENVQCNINVRIHVRTPFGRTQVSGTYIKTLNAESSDTILSGM